MQNENIWEGYSLPIVVDDNMKHNQKAEKTTNCESCEHNIKNPLLFSKIHQTIYILIDFNNKKSVFLAYVKKGTFHSLVRS